MSGHSAMPGNMPACAPVYGALAATAELRACVSLDVGYSTVALPFELGYWWWLCCGTCQLSE